MFFRPSNYVTSRSSHTSHHVSSPPAWNLESPSTPSAAPPLQANREQSQHRRRPGGRAADSEACWAADMLPWSWTPNLAPAKRPSLGLSTPRLLDTQVRTTIVVLMARHHPIPRRRGTTWKVSLLMSLHTLPPPTTGLHLQSLLSP